MPTIREVADNAWLLLLSRIAAACAIPVAMGVLWIYATTITLQRDVNRHEVAITQNRERIAMREANAFTAADAAAMEARLSTADDRLLEELRLLRQELAEDRRNP